MSPPDSLSTLRRRLELGRLVLGSALETLIKAYGAGAVLAVALSDAETVGGKGSDALRAVPSLAEEYDHARYALDHREEIQSAITYLDEHTLPQEELQRSAADSVETLGAIETTYDEMARARDVLEIDGFVGTFANVREALGHIDSAYDARPDLDSIRQLAEVADRVGPLADQVDVLVPVYYGSFFTLTDNLAGDEVVGTLTVMALALGVAWVLGRAVGFWVRRGRPGLVDRLLQRLGARTFRRWYVRHLPYALSPPLYDAAREHLQREIVADPERALDEDTLRALEQHFTSRTDDSAG